MHENAGRAREISEHTQENSEHAHARENVLYFRAHAKTSRGGTKNAAGTQRCQRLALWRHGGSHHVVW